MKDKEELVSIYIARCLRDLGFDWLVTSCYNDNPDLKEDSKVERYKTKPINYNAFNQLQVFSLPTQSLAQRWIRDNYKINISINYSNITKNHWAVFVEGFGNNKFYTDSISFPSYEDALEKGLEIAIEYIKKIML